MSPALAGGFFTTEPPGKPPCILFNVWILYGLWWESKVGGGSVFLLYNVNPKTESRTRLPWALILLLCLPATMTWNKLLSLSVFIPKMEIKNSICVSNTGFLVFIHIP